MAIVRKVLTAIIFIRKALTHNLVLFAVVHFIIYGAMSLSYARGDLTLTDGKAVIDFTALVTRFGGKVWMIYLGIPLLAAIVYATPYVLKFRNWWVHTDNHKIDLPRLRQWLKLSRSSEQT